MMLTSTSNIFLVGLMGSGKTTIGRALAKRLNLRFVDAEKPGLLKRLFGGR